MEGIILNFLTMEQQAQTTESGLANLPSNIPQNLKPVINEQNTVNERKLSASPYLQNNDKAQWLFACETHKYVREFINSADNKAQRYIAFSSAILVWLMNVKENIKFWDIPAKEWRLLEVLNFVSLSGLSICILLSLVAILPRLKGSKKGIIFFESVAEHEVSTDYLSDVLKKNEQELVIEELKHVYELSNICSKKFFWLKIAVWAGGVGLVSGILFLLIH